jgi:glycosyltransferase involved in cell wall biosynthesis
MGLWQELKGLEPTARDTNFAEEAPSAALSLLIPARNCAHSLEATVREATRYLETLHPQDWEIILIPNPKPGDTRDQTPRIAEELARSGSVNNPQGKVRVIHHLAPPGKGAALRTGFSISRGRVIGFTDADLPYDLEFFGRATARIRAGVDLVTGNRRLPDSQFDVPVGLLKLAYGRHRLGLLFNRAVRLLFPLGTTDTQAGIKALSRRLATRAFGRQICPGFFFDLELFLTARGLGWRWEELPVTLYLNSEKSTVRLAREAVLAVFWLLRLSLRNLRGAYRGN